MGFKDGTNNLKLEDTSMLDANVGSATRPTSPGCRAAVTWSFAASACASSHGPDEPDQQEQTFGRRRTTERR